MSVDELLEAVVTELRAVGKAADLADLDACQDDAARGRIIYDVATELRTVDRRLFLRCAGAFLSHALRCRSEGDLASAEWWRGCAEAELERYREQGPELHPYVTTGGAQ